MSSSQSSRLLARRAESQSVSAWHGAVMDRPCLLVTPIISSVLGVLCREHRVFERIRGFMVREVLRALQ